MLLPLKINYNKAEQLLFSSKNLINLSRHWININYLLLLKKYVLQVTESSKIQSACWGYNTHANTFHFLSLQVSGIYIYIGFAVRGINPYTYLVSRTILYACLKRFLTIYKGIWRIAIRRDAPTIIRGSTFVCI